MSNTKITIKDIAVIAEFRANNQPPIGEGPRYGDDDSFMSDDERIQMHDRLSSSITQLIEQAKNDHELNNTGNSSNTITRLSTNEFFFYTREPLSLIEFERLQNKIADQLKELPPGIQLILGSFAVKTKEGKVMNVTPHLSSEDPPEFHFIVKSYTSDIDVNYKQSNGRTLNILDGHSPQSELPTITVNKKPISFTCNNVLRCKTPGNEPFLTLIDICKDHLMSVAKNNFEALAASDETILTLPVSHVVVSNTIYLVPKHSLGTVMHTDPTTSFGECKSGVVQTRIKLGPIFGEDRCHMLFLAPTVCLSAKDLKDIENERKLYAENMTKQLNEILQGDPPDPLLMAIAISQHPVDDQSELIKKMPSRSINITFVNALRDKEVLKTLPIKIIESLVYQNKTIFLSDQEVINSIHVNGPIAPEIAVATFPDNITVLKKACEEDPVFIAIALSENGVDPELIKNHLSNEGPITPKIALEAFPDNMAILKKACEINPSFFVSNINTLQINANFIKDNISKQGPITPEIAVTAFPNNLEVIKKACKEDPTYIISDSAKSHIPPHLIKDLMSGGGPISPEIAMEHYNRNNDIRSQAFSNGVLGNDDSNTNLKAAVAKVNDFFTDKERISIVQFPNNDVKKQAFVDLHEQYKKLDNETSEMHQHKKEVIKAAMQSLLTGNNHYLKNILGDNGEKNKKFDMRQIKFWGISQTEALAIRTLKLISTENAATPCNAINQFKETKENFRRLIREISRPNVVSEKTIEPLPATTNVSNDPINSDSTQYSEPKK